MSSGAWGRVDWIISLKTSQFQTSRPNMSFRASCSIRSSWSEHRSEMCCVTSCSFPPGFGSSFHYWRESVWTKICSPLKLKSGSVGNFQKILSQISHVVCVLVYKYLKIQQDCCIVTFVLMICFVTSLPQRPLTQIKRQKKNAKNCSFLGNRDNSLNSTWVGIEGFCWLKLTYIFSILYFLIINMWFQHQPVLILRI